MKTQPPPKRSETQLGEDWIRHGNEVRLERGRPFLFVSPWVIRPTTGVRYRAEGRGYRATLVNVTSENIQVAMESPTVIPAPLALTPRWEAFNSHFRTVLYDGGMYRMWYESMPPGWRHDFDCRLHYAESHDGIEWRKPRLSKPRAAQPGPSNRVYPMELETCFHGASVFRDPSDREWPYKMGYWGSAQKYTEWRAAPEAQRSLEMQGAVSRDGLHWIRLPEPLMRQYQSDTQSVVRYDARSRKYVGFFRCLCYERRGIAYAETSDFAHWRKPEPLLVDPSPHEDLYTNAYTVYPFNPDQHFLFPAIFRRGADNFHLRTYSSLDGRIWAPVGTAPLLRAEEAAGTLNALVCAGINLLPLENGRKIGLPLGMLNMPHNAIRRLRDKVRIDYAWMVWDRDRMGAVISDGDAEFTTVKLTAPRGRLSLNFKTTMGGVIRVAVCDQGYQPIPGYGFDDCNLLNGDCARARVAWGAGRETLPETERLVLRFHLRCAKLYAMTIT